jgi:hypothetical protein
MTGTRGPRGRAVLQGLCVLLLGLLLAGGARDAAGADPALVVQVDGGRLTLHASGVALRSVLRAVAGAGNLTLVLDAPLEEEVTIALDDVPLDEGVRRLLGSRDHVLVYAATTLTLVRVETPRGTAPAPRGLVAFLPEGDSTARVKALEALADTDAVSFDLLLDLVLRDPTAAVRTRALELLREREADDARVHDVVLMASRNDPDREVREAAASLLEGFRR